MDLPGHLDTPPRSRLHVTFPDGAVAVGFHGPSGGGPRELFSAEEWSDIVQDFKAGRYDLPVSNIKGLPIK